MPEGKEHQLKDDNRSTAASNNSVEDLKSWFHISGHTEEYRREHRTIAR
jgi:hypothetical protein